LSKIVAVDGKTIVPEAIQGVQIPYRTSRLKWPKTVATNMFLLDTVVHISPVFLQRNKTTPSAGRLVAPLTPHNRSVNREWFRHVPKDVVYNCHLFTQSSQA